VLAKSVSKKESLRRCLIVVVSAAVKENGRGEKSKLPPEQKLSPDAYLGTLKEIQLCSNAGVKQLGRREKG